MEGGVEGLEGGGWGYVYIYIYIYIHSNFAGFSSTPLTKIKPIRRCLSVQVRRGCRKENSGADCWLRHS